MDAPEFDKSAAASTLRDGFARALKRKTLSLTEQDFIDQVVEDFREDELPELSPETLTGMLADLWRDAEHRSGHEPAIRLRGVDGGGGDRPLDLLEIVQDDAPFLVDSVMGELAAQQLDVLAMFHPVVSVGRGEDGRRSDEGLARRESMILVVLGPLGEDRRDRVVDGVKATLGDVRAAVEDFDAMSALMRRTIAELRGSMRAVRGHDLDEHLDLLRWLTADRFVFLGARIYTYPRDASGDYVREEPAFDPQESLGILRDPARSVLRRESEPAILSPTPKAFLEASPPVTVAKSNLRSRVHRRTHADYIGVKRYGADGSPFGEVRFIGLFTSDAYDEPARNLPLLRRKLEHVLARASTSPSAHAERRLRQIVETYPRDELFQIGEDALLATALGILHLYDRPRVRLFAWTDPFDRFASALLFLPRERYDSSVQEKAGEILARAWGGGVSAVYPRFSDLPLARLHYIIRLNPGAHPEPDLRAAEAEIAEMSRSWSDRFGALVRSGGAAEGEVGPMLARYGQAFPAGYRDRYGPEEALTDLRIVDGLGQGEALRVRAYRRPDDAESQFRFKLYVPDAPAPLSDVLPVLEHMGLRGLEEAGFEISPAGEPGGRPVWIHDYLLADAAGQPLAFEALQEPFEAAFVAVWSGRVESDGFNRLVLALGIGWREAALIRAVARYRQQAGVDPSQSVQEQALSDHPDVARLVLELFRVKFDPGADASIEERRSQAEAVSGQIEQALQAVSSLDADRALRRIAATVRAMTRTNYYQAAEGDEPKPYISFKVSSRDIEALPDPKPFREIFVSATRVEGVHLRFGPVARGGLRWSDRRDDFRTEVLGLVKAQQVKNAVIVPVGAKGGFYPKRLPKAGEGGQDAVRNEAVEAYKTFLYGLLDLTDNLDADGKVEPPPGLVIHDEDDPYLVVAADKGTASFSDIANGVAESYGFWLGDAFASGGSAGYDHKAMGITARGAWEAVKRHFRELGKDIQTEPFTCVGVGDMSGDVFGNGMLLSKATKLVAAFDHRHVFLDPDPDPQASWDERKRMFDLPRSSWDDYDKAKISKGGGVFPRSAKTIRLTPQVKAMLDLEADELAPTELIRAILKARVELLYLGGIGTYVKAPVESHAQVSDKANDAVRIDGPELRCLVVGEGANLGVTQAGRIAYARQGGPDGKGGRIDTDAIDNSAGVDTSDHEVNIKILTGAAERAGGLTREDRDELLRSMTDEIAAHVLAHNYAQTLALSLEEAEAPALLDAHGRFMAELVAAGRLDRRVEGLPGPVVLADMQAQGLGLTRPEIAVLLAYAKLELSAEIVAGSAPDDPWFERTLKAYFPSGLARFEAEMQRHRLRREIIATVLANAMVDMAGPTFPSRLKAALGCDACVLARAFEAARQVFRLDEQWAAVAALDLKVPAGVQLSLFQDVARTLRAQTYWLARRTMAATEADGEQSVQALVERYQPVADTLHAAGPELLSAFDREAVERRAQGFIGAGAPEDMAHAVAHLSGMTTTTEIADLAREADWPAEAAARLFHGVGAAFGFDRLRGAAGALNPADPYELTAVRRLIAELVEEQTAVARAVIAQAGDAAAGETVEAAEAAITAWSEPRKASVERARRSLDEIEQAGHGWSFAKLTIANAALRQVLAAAG